MNKTIVIGAIIVVIIGIALVSAAITMDFSIEDTGSISEVMIEESEESKGKDLSVSFDESISLKGP
ncbi:MAG: hypothetical protein ACE5DT_04695 [Nitrosopumilus sp.]